MTQERQEMARRFLMEVVYGSRARQAAGAALLGGRLDQASGPGSCGLGERAAIEWNLSERGRELLELLWPSEPEEERWNNARELMRTWIERSDALDRKRNHFLRDFRQQHGVDRAAYSEEQRGAYESGLERINGDVGNELDQAAVRLIDV
jgi:hypothetical protein